MCFPVQCHNRLTASLVAGLTELLSAVLRQHVSVAISAPTPIVTAINNILIVHFG